MIVLDTNVVSELMRGSKADRRLLTWLRAAPEIPVTTVMTRAELLTGLAIMPSGRRRDDLALAVERAFEAIPAVLEWSERCAVSYADVVVRRRSGGRPVATADAVIASICLRHGASLATRNTKDFDGIGLDLINPWA